MDDNEILMRGGTEHDIESYANRNGADLTKDDVMVANYKPKPKENV